MAIVPAIGCAALSWAGCYVLLSGSVPAAMPEMRARRVWARLGDLLGAMASLRLVELLAGVSAWADLADLLRARLEAAASFREAIPFRTLTREEGVALLLVLVAGATVLGGLASRSVVGCVVVGGGCVIGVHVLDSSRERRRASALAEEMPDIFRTLAIALGSGQTLSQAIDYVGSHERGPAAEEFARTSLRLRCGVSAEEALSLMVDELEAPGVGLLVTALLISQRTGSPLRDLFQRSARLVERQGEFERMLAVKTAQAKLSVRIVCLLPVLMIAVLSLISPDFQRGLSTVAGTGCVLLALGMDAVALLIIRRLMKGVL